MKYLKAILFILSVPLWSLLIFTYIPFVLITPIDYLIYSYPRLLRWWEDVLDQVASRWIDLLLDTTKPQSYDPD